MCGRYRLSRRKQILEEHFLADWDDLADWIPRFNIAPTQLVPVIRQNPKEPKREMSMMRWGVIPVWSKESSGAAKMINARSETATTQAAFRDAMKFRRCLVPADGFYEWQKKGSAKQPFIFEVNEGDLFAFAGLWERWKNPKDGKWIETCAILTTTPNDVTSGIHDRMPVILDPADYDLWLDPGFKDAKAVSDLLKPYDARQMRRYPVSNRVNSVVNEDDSCSTPIDLPTDPPAEQQGELF
jgi:putative SOS response-associated peptidase YedK